MCSQVLLFGRHTWGERCEGGSKSQSKMCHFVPELSSRSYLLSWQPVGHIIPHKGKYIIQSLSAECVYIWD